MNFSKKIRHTFVERWNTFCLFNAHKILNIFMRIMTECSAIWLPFITILISHYTNLHFGIIAYCKPHGVTPSNSSDPHD